MIPPNMKYSDIRGTDKRTISINEAVSDDVEYYADKKGLSFSRFAEEAIIEKILRTREELGEILTREQYNALYNRAIKTVLAENKMIQSGQITHEDLAKGKQDTLETAR